MIRLKDKCSAFALGLGPYTPHGPSWLLLAFAYRGRFSTREGNVANVVLTERSPDTRPVQRLFKFVTLLLERPSITIAEAAPALLRGSDIDSPDQDMSEVSYVDLPALTIFFL